MPANLENSAVATGLIKVSFHSNPKECSNYCAIAFISRTTNVMIIILQARLQQYVNHELPDVQTGFRKGRGIRDPIANIHQIIKKAREFQKNIYFSFLTMPKPLTVWITNCGKFLKRGEYQATWPASWEICIQVKKQQLELDMEQQTGVKFWKEYLKAVYCHPTYLTYVQSTSREMLGWGSTSWNQYCREKYQQPQICRWHHPYGRMWRTKELLDESEKGE